MWDARMGYRAVTAGLVLLLSAGIVQAGDVYVIRFFAGVWPTGVPCEGYFWQDKLMFHNSTTTEQKVRLLGVSNSLPRPDARDLVLPPGASVSVTQDFASGGRQETSLNWFPLVAFEPLLFVNHLDVPAGVIVASRIESHQSGSLCTAFPTYSNKSFGLLALPVHRFLTPAGTRQYHLGTDLGSDGLGLTNPSHTNVGIYNGEPAAANATIELRRSCDDGLITSRTVRVPENSVVQTAGPTNDVSGYGPGCAIGILPQIYTVVTVDQPSFSYAVTLSNEIPPKIPISVSGASN
jgi:hypothetical protein